MVKNIINQSGHLRRTPSDNRVITSGGSVIYENKTVDYEPRTQSWLLSGNVVGTLSDLSKELGLMKETHDIGIYLEKQGYQFKVPFQYTQAKDWTERECYFAVWGYDQLDQDRDIVKKHLYQEIASIIGRSDKSIEWKIQNVSACDPRQRVDKPISEAPNVQSLLQQVFKAYWQHKDIARSKYPTYLQEAQFDAPSSTEKVSEHKDIIIEEGALGFRESACRKRSVVLLTKGRNYYRGQELDNLLRCKACGFSTPVGLSREIVQLHHTVPIADSGAEGRTTSIEEAIRLLLPLCPTCHQISHTSSPPLDLETIIAIRLGFRWQ